MQKVIKNTLLTLLSILLAIAILWWMYRGFDWVAIREGFSSKMKWSWMLWSLPFGILAQFFRALRWRQALRPLGESPRLRTSIDDTRDGGSPEVSVELSVDFSRIEYVYVGLDVENVESR